LSFKTAKNYIFIEGFELLLTYISYILEQNHACVVKIFNTYFIRG